MTQLVKWNLKNNTWILAEIINRVNKIAVFNKIHEDLLMLSEYCIIEKESA